MIGHRLFDKSSSTRRTSQILAAAVSLAIACEGHAQTPDNGNSLAEIVVTANRRAQSVLDVPYNISAVTGKTLAHADIKSLNDIEQILPGVIIPDLGPRANSSNSLIIIRGMNVNDPVASAYLPWGSVPTVSTYVDDVPLFVNLRLFDIERIEVLRGPQGTLYGSGAEGGTVRILHNPPRLNHFSAEVSTDVSQTQHAANVSYDTDGILNIPIGHSAAVRLDAGYAKTAGFIDASNAVVFDAHQQPVLADPANPLTSGLTYQHLRGINAAESYYTRVALDWNTTSWLKTSMAYQRQDDHSNGFSHQTESSPQLTGYNYVTQTLVPNEPDHRVVDLESLTLTADAGFATVTSSTSYSVDNDANTYDESQFVIGYNLAGPTLYGNYPRVTSLFFNTTHDTALTQEIRLVSRRGGPWDYVVGAFFQHQTEHLYQYETVPGFAYWSDLPGSGAAIPSTVPGAPYSTFGDFVQYYNQGTRPSSLSPVDENFTFLQLSGFEDRAFYGELTRHLTSRWQITGGARIFWQNFSQSLHSTIPYGGPFFSTLPPPANATDSLGTTNTLQSKSYHNHLFKLNTSYKATRDTRVYATFSEGFRHGGVNALPVGNCIFCESPSLIPYRSDSVKNYEVGYKGVVDGWLNFSAAVYRVNWDNVQIQVFGQAGDPAVVNGKTARSQGVELEMGGNISRHWSLQVGYSFTDAKVLQNFSVTEPIPGTTSVYTDVAAKAGDRLPYVPRQTLTGSVGYARFIGHGLSMDAHLNAVYRSNVTTQIDQNVLGYRQLGGFTTVSGSVGLTVGSHWHFRIFGDNLTNVLGVTSSGSLYRGYDDPRYRIENVTPPRTIGVGAAYKFD